MLGCIQSEQEFFAGNPDWEDANLDCWNTYGGRLPFSTEWHIAANSGFFTYSSNEWLADGAGADAEADRHLKATGATASESDLDTTNGLDFRCFLPK